MLQKMADIGLIGLGVMGENLVLNMENKGYRVAVFNRSPERVTKFIEGKAKSRDIIGTYSLEELIGHLKKPRIVMLMVKAGRPVDDFIEMLLPLLQQGDIVIDGGNSYYPDTQRRMEQLRQKGLLYIGAGVSGGEEGALKGPSIMPGGSVEAWPHVKPIFQAIAAKLDDGTPCCDWIGDGGSGHFVKMVHNGIEYGDMQLICEAYHLMRDLAGMTAYRMHEVFDAWNKGELESYLIEITADILRRTDDDGSPLVEKIADSAGQKGTGKWTVESSLNEGVPLTLIGEAVFARFLSALSDERSRAQHILKGPKASYHDDKKQLVEDIRKALYASKIISYAQGYSLMRSTATTYGWNLNYGGIALVWRGGCIIRSAFLGRIKEAFDKDPCLLNLLLDSYFKENVADAQEGWRRVVAAAVVNGIPVPAFSSALSYYDGLRCGKLPANLLQAQRDYFGAHAYERIDRPRGEFFHTDWTGSGGTVNTSTYTA